MACTFHFCVYMQMMELSLPAGSRRVSLEQRLAEAEGYYHLLREQVQVRRGEWEERGRAKEHKRT